MLAHGVRILLAVLSLLGMTFGYAMALGWQDKNLFLGLPIALLSLGIFCWTVWVPNLDPMRRCIYGFAGMAWETAMLIVWVPRLAPSTWIKEHLEVWVAIGAATTGIFALAFLVGAGFARAVQPSSKP